MTAGQLVVPSSNGLNDSSEWSVPFLVRLRLRFETLQRHAATELSVISEKPLPHAAGPEPAANDVPTKFQPVNGIMSIARADAGFRRGGGPAHIPPAPRRASPRAP